MGHKKENPVDTERIQNPKVMQNPKKEGHARTVGAYFSCFR